ncbi:MAG: tetratricopeptide repeat protein [Micavibrio sp.]|nr:tetratricopeptide repeat protein [Micavibrio sp.]
MKNFVLMLLSSVVGVTAGIAIVNNYLPHVGGESEMQDSDSVNYMDLTPEERYYQTLRNGPYQNKTISGYYLSGRFAQRNHDWKTAQGNLEKILNKTGEDDIELMKRTMVLSMGAGEYSKAISLAHKVKELSGEDSESSALAYLFIGLEATKAMKYKEANEAISEMPEGSLSDFIMPLLNSWAAAALGAYDVGDLRNSIMHYHHAILIADMMDKPEEIKELLNRALAAPDLNSAEYAWVASVYAHIGEQEKALELYEKLYDAAPISEIKTKIEALKNDTYVDEYKGVKSASEGIALAMYNMASLLAQDINDDSARVFAQIALYLDSDLSDAKFLLASIAARNGREGDAIAFFEGVQADSPDYIPARKAAAGLYETKGEYAKAVEILEPIYEELNDIDALIQIGDVYRHNEEYAKAVKYYNQAEKAFEGEVSGDHWHLYYVRGMSYEQLKKWDKAEADLKKALEYEPDHPFVLNYLGYAWADQGVNLEKALEMIEKASALEPQDGYIADSLGWVLYRMGKFEEAVPHLERAVELRPYDAVINDHLGDAYWRVGRRLEAKFQWLRAKNHAEEDTLVSKLDVKLIDGLPAAEAGKSGLMHAENSTLPPPQQLNSTD